MYTMDFFLPYKYWSGIKIFCIKKQCSISYCYCIRFVNIFTIFVIIFIAHVGNIISHILLQIFLKICRENNVYCYG